MTRRDHSITSRSPRQTHDLGRAVASVLRVGDVIALIGPLGAGKTQFVRGLAVGLGVDPRLVASPTFVLMHEYPGRITLVHIDAYRIRGLSDLESAGWSQELWADAAVVVEWADRIEAELPADRLTITFTHEPGDCRRIELTPHGESWRQRLEAVYHALKASEPAT